MEKKIRFNFASRLIWSDFFDGVDENFIGAYASDCADLPALTDALEEYARDCVEQEASGNALNYAGLYLDRVQWQEIARRLDREHGILGGAK